jgi:hypothetical protein
MTLDPGAGLATGRRGDLKGYEIAWRRYRAPKRRRSWSGWPATQKRDESGPLPSRCARALVCINDAWVASIRFDTLIWIK